MKAPFNQQNQDAILRAYLLGQCKDDLQTQINSWIEAEPSENQELVEQAQSELFDDYLSELLNEDDAKSFESRLDSDREFAQSFEMEKSIRFSLEHQDAFDIQELIAGLDQVEEKAEPKVIDMGRRRAIYSVLALAAGLAIFWLAILPQMKQGNSNGLTAEFYQAPDKAFFESKRPSFLAAQGFAGNENKKAYSEYLNAFDSGNYSKASQLMNEAIRGDETAVEMIFLRACALTENGQLEEAAKDFEIVRSSNNQYRYDASWFLAWNYLEDGQSDKAKALFQSLTERPNSYQKQAKALLAKGF